MKKLTSTTLALLFVAAAYGQSTVKGYVFNDANKNGKMDKREAGLPNVGVSNGIEVEQTNAKGYYELPLRDGQVYFVIKPSGYQSPLDDNNLPKNHYIYKTKGSPQNFKYKGSAPTGTMPAQLNFPMLPTPDSKQFRVLLFGDPQPYTQTEVDYFAKGIVQEVAGIKNTAFGLSLGDLVGDDLSLHGPYIKAVKKVGLPWYNVMGNHDMNYEAEADSVSDETFEANFGPANYSFNYGNVHFIVLDDIIYPDPRDQKGYWGGLRKDQLQFLANDLKFVPKDRLVVLSFHIPLLNTPENENYRPEDRQQYFDLLKDYPYTLSLSAHTHLQRQNFYGKEDGWKQEKPHHEYNAGTTSGDWYSGELNEQGVPASTMRDGTPKGYAFLNFNNNQYTVDYKVAGKPDTFQVKLFAPKVVPAGRNTSAGIYANFFMGAKDDSVSYSVDGGEWKAMTYVEGADPDFLSILHKFDHTSKLLNGRRPSNPEDCTHLWRAPIAAKDRVGVHNVEVKAIDRYGKEHRASISYRLEERGM